MKKIPHLFLRGTIYYWRRKMRRFSTEFIDMQISTLTTNRQNAIIVCRGLTAKSDFLMGKMDKHGMAEAEMKAFLLAERDRLHQRLELKQNVFKNDIVEDGHDNHIHDWASEQSWRLFREFGINVSLTEEVLRFIGKFRKSKKHVDMLAFYLELNRNILLNEGTLNRLKARFQDVNGREPTEYKEILQLRQLYIQAQVASYDYTARNGISSYADEVFAEFDGVRRPDEIPAPGSEASSRAASEEVSQQKQVFEPTNEPEDHVFDPSISAVVERMIECKKHDHGGLVETTAKHYRNFALLFSRITGKSDVRTLTQSDAAVFRNALMKLPKSYGKSPKHKTQTIEETLKESAHLPKEERGLSISTMNRYFDHLGATLAFAKSEGIRIDERINPSSLRRREQIRDRDKAKTATESELVQLFQHPLWSDRRSVTNKLEREKKKLDGGYYWIPLLCAHGGFRRAEAAGLRLSDLKQEDGIYYFDLDFNEDRRLKTGSSIRKIPLHNDLLELGFIEFYQSQTQQRATHFFPEAFERSKLHIGRKISRSLQQVCVEVFGEQEELLTLKSTRHYVQQILDLDPSVPEKVARDILGHEGYDVHTRTYGTASPLRALKAAIDVLPSVIDTSIKY
jgi:integrase